MRTARTRLSAALAILAALCAQSATAAEPGFYVGFMYGDASSEYNVEPFDNLTRAIYDLVSFAPAQRAFTKGNDSEAYGFLAGYRLTQHIAFEGGYSALGKQTYRENSSGVFVTGDPETPEVAEDWAVSLSSKTGGFSLSALGILPISYAWEVYARAGVLIGSNSMSIYASNGTDTLVRDEFSESSTDWLAGAGIAVSLAEVYALRAEFQRIFDAGAEEFGESDLDLISIGLTVAF
jgi:hypothetical protein